MQVNGYKCDRESCSAAGMTASHQTHPDGWIIVFGPTFRNGDRVGTSSWHFCSWDCAGSAVTLLSSDDVPSIAVVPALREASA